MKDLNYFPLQMESNIYGMATLEFEDGTSKVLVATSECKIYCIDYNKFKSHTREVEFTYIPTGAEIISIGAFRRGPNDFAVGITHSLAPNPQKGTSAWPNSSLQVAREVNELRSTTYYLNIYASGSASHQFDLDYLAQGCQTIRLRYVPYHLYQAADVVVQVSRGTADGSPQAVGRKPYWLLSGGDNSIHAFCENQPYQSFNEVPIVDCFPELVNLPSIALWIDSVNVENCFGRFERAIALGFEDGSVRLFHSVFNELNSTYSLVKESSFDEYTTIIPAVRFFKVKSSYKCDIKSRLLQDHPIRERSHHDDDELSRMNLLAVSSTNPSLIFKDVLQEGLNCRTELPESMRLDCVVTSAVGDTNFDGFNELLLGSHGRELMLYNYDVQKKHYYLANMTELNYPVHVIEILNLTGDAIKEVVILLTSGVLVMQSSIRDVVEICERRIDSLLNSLGGE